MRLRAWDSASGAVSAAELHHQPAAAFRQKRKAFGIDPLGPRVVSEKIVETFKADGLVLHDLGNMIGTLVNVGIGEDQQNPFGRAFHEAASGFKNGDAGAFGADERAGYMEAVFRKKIIQVVAGDAAGDFGKALPDQIAVLIGDLLQRIAGFERRDRRHRGAIRPGRRTAEGGCPHVARCRF